MLYADALRRRGFEVSGAASSGPRAVFDGAAAVVLRSTWGYYRALVEFRAWTEAMAASTRLFNPIGLVRWNLRKDYVGKLATAGIRTPATRIVAREAADIERVFDETGWRRAVVRPATGGSGHSVELLRRDTVAAAMPRLAAGDVLVQEFLPEIAEGELSMVYFDGVFNHAISARPRASSAATRATVRRVLPRRRRARWRSRARPPCVCCPRCRSMPASMAWCARVR
jgi:glutathione synthase/RimK-type ligase-like ATP-grasp enzyme